MKYLLTAITLLLLTAASIAAQKVVPLSEADVTRLAALRAQVAAAQKQLDDFHDDLVQRYVSHQEEHEVSKCGNLTYSTGGISVFSNCADTRTDAQRAADTKKSADAEAKYRSECIKKEMQWVLNDGWAGGIAFDETYHFIIQPVPAPPATLKFGGAYLTGAN